MTKLKTTATAVRAASAAPLRADRLARAQMSAYPAGYVEQLARVFRHERRLRSARRPAALGAGA